MNTQIERKVSEVITYHTLVKETENHIFKITNYNADTDKNQRLRGVIEHKDGTHCGDFMVNRGRRGMLSVNLNMDCKELLTDLLAMLADIEAGDFVEVDQFNYEKDASAEA